MREQLIQQFANNVTQSVLQQLNSLWQQPNEPVAQFAVKLKQLLLRVDPNMKETMKLYFLLPRLRHDLYRCVRDQGPTSFHMVIQIAQRIEAPHCIELPPSTQLVSNNHHKQPNDSSVSPRKVTYMIVVLKASHVVFTVMGMAMLKNIAGNF